MLSAAEPPTVSVCGASDNTDGDIKLPLAGIDAFKRQVRVLRVVRRTIRKASGYTPSSRAMEKVPWKHVLNHNETWCRAFED
jgi:hypothetical protein